MKFTGNKQTLLKALTIVSKAVSSRTTMPVLKGILLEIKEEKELILTASDMDITIENRLSLENSVSGTAVEKGTALVPAKLFSDIIRKLPAESEIVFETKDGKMDIQCMNSHFEVVLMPTEEFPNMYQTSPDAEEINFDRKNFISMIQKTSFAASTEISRGVITGVLISLKKNKLEMVAIDGYRLAVARTPVTSAIERDMIISARILNEVVKIAFDLEEGDDLKLIADGKTAVLRMGAVKVVMRLLQGSFIKYEDILPKSSTTEISVNRKDIIDSIDRASVLISEARKTPIKFSILDDLMSLTSNSEEGNVKEDVLCKKTGDDLAIGFNSRYMLDALKVIDEEDVNIFFNTAISPCLIKPAENDAYSYIVLPVRLSGI